MKLVLATPLYPPEGGGPATFAKTIEEELPKRGLAVVLVKFSDVRHLPKLVRHIAYGWRVWRAAHDADLILALDPVSVGLPALVVSRLLGCPFYLRIGGDYAWEQGMARWGVEEGLDAFLDRHTRSLPVHLLQRVESLVARYARKVLVPGEYLAQIVVRWGVLPANVRVVHNPAPRLDDRYARLLESPYIVSIGRLVPQKGMAGVIDAFARIAKDDETLSLSLVIVDDGPERSHLVARAANLGLAERVIFAGNVSHEKVMSWLAHADAFVLNSSYECFSHLVLEAFTVGTPVLASDVPGDAEITRDRSTALLFSFNDSSAIAERVREIRRDHGLRDKLTHNARALAEQFTLARMIDETVHALTL